MENRKNFKTLLISMLVLIVLFNVRVQASEYIKDPIMAVTEKSEWVPTTALYFELGGKFFPSINIDFRKRENFAISIGTGFWKDSEEHEQMIFSPSVNAYYLFGKRNRIEIGGGTGPFLGTYSGLASLLVFGNIGYRVQKKEGLFFRAGFTPFLGIPLKDDLRFFATPWIGISLGYSF